MKSEQPKIDKTDIRVAACETERHFHTKWIHCAAPKSDTLLFWVYGQ